MLQLIPQMVLRFAAGLRFRDLFLLALGLFLIDLVVPDAIPFIDEILLGLLTLLTACLRTRKPSGGRVFEASGQEKERS
jgi:hypothetical protein